MDAPRVLLVDDMKEYSETLAERLRLRDVLTEVASDGKEALEKIEEQEFDVVILDVVMPEMDGLEVLRQIRDIRPHLPVLMLTGKEFSIPKAIRSMDLGAMDYLSKPVPLETLLKKIGEAQKRRAALDGIPNG